VSLPQTRLGGAVQDKPPYRIPLVSEIQALPRNGRSFVSTFSGCGGSCLGFEMDGWTPLIASEFIPAAQEVYALNHPTVPVIVQDVREVEAELILARLGLERGELDCLEGSPPCASFSMAGKRTAGWGEVRKYSDTEQRVDDLFFEYVRLLDGLLPKTFVAENVTGLMKGVAKGYFNEIRRALAAVGYRVRVLHLDAQWLGVPQSRQRVIFVGVRSDLGLEPPTVEKLPYRYTVRDAIPLAVRIGTAPPHADWQAVGKDVERTMVSAEGNAAPTMVASGENKGAGWVEMEARIPVRVVHDTRGNWSRGEVTDSPCPTITVGMDSLNSVHYEVEEEVVRVPVDVGWESYDVDRGSVADRPAPTITGHGVSGDNDDTLTVECVEVPREVWDEAVAYARENGAHAIRLPIRVEHDPGGDFTDYGDVSDTPSPAIMATGPHRMVVHEVALPLPDQETHERQREEADITRFATGPEWDKLAPGEQSDRYFNLVKADPDAPSPTVTCSTAWAIGAAGVVHPVERRKFTIPELRRICGFPDDFQLTGTYRQQWERLGRAVPPPMMRAVAQAVREQVLDKLDSRP
jgi:DNA-cytosine methyltransferase